MREIKFRAWDKVNKNMLYDVSTGTVTIWYKEISSKSENCVFMQYSGLKDANGKEIYEGDILLQKISEDDDGIIATVKYETMSGDYCKGIGFNIVDRNLTPLNLDYSTVIGNIYEDSHLLDNSNVKNRIYENPELLERIK